MSVILFKPGGGGGGSGSGFGGINYITNPNASAVDVTPWVTYADAAGSQPVNGAGGSPVITLTRDTNSLTIGETSFLVTKDAANRQGEGVSCEFAVDTSVSDNALPVSISFYCAPSANFVYGSIDGVTPSDITAYVYSIDDNALVAVFPNVITNSGYFTGQFQAIEATNYRLILHIGTTNALAWTFAFSEVIVTPAQANFIPADSDWQSYTPTFTGFGTPTGVNFRYRKQGPNLEISGNFTSGTPTGVEARVSLPTGLTTSSIVTTVEIGNIWVRNISNANKGGIVISEPSVSYFTFGTQNTFGPDAGTPLTKILGNAMVASGQAVYVSYKVPIQGWTSGFTTADTVLQNVPVTFRALKNGGAVTANTTIPSWTMVDDSVGAFNATTGVYTVKYPGKYLVSGNIAVSGNVTRAVRVNGNIVFQNSHSVANQLIPPGQLTLSVGDTVTITVSGNDTVTSSSTETQWSLTKAETPAASMNIRKIATLKDEKAANTAGGTATSGSYATRTLNTEVDPYGIVSLSANQFILQPGTYRILASAPAQYVGSHKAVLRNVTASTYTIIGTSEIAEATGPSVMTKSIVDGVFSITVATTFEIQHRVAVTKATNGFGVAANFGDVEVYTQVEIEKLL